MNNPSSSKHKIKNVSPKLHQLIGEAVYSDIWERPYLTKRERSMITLAALIGMRQTPQMRTHMEKGLMNGLEPEAMSEIITHLAYYAGFPAALSAGIIAGEFFEEIGFTHPDVKE